MTKKAGKKSASPKAKKVSKALQDELTLNQTPPDKVPQLPSDLPEHFFSPESSNVFGAGYDPEKKALYVFFQTKAEDKDPKSCYSYLEPPVTVNVWANFRVATSKGQFFAAYIRKQYKGVQVW